MFAMIDYLCSCRFSNFSDANMCTLNMTRTKEASALHVVHNCYGCTLITCIVFDLVSLLVYLLEYCSSASSVVAHKTSSSYSIRLFLSI
jgi:hypothetical protein